MDDVVCSTLLQLMDVLSLVTRPLELQLVSTSRRIRTPNACRGTNDLTAFVPSFLLFCCFDRHPVLLGG